MSNRLAFSRYSAIALLASTISGCSFLFTTKPQPRDANSAPGPVECTSSRVAPAIDSSVVLGESIFITDAMLRDDNAYTNRGVYIGVSAGIAAVALASAVILSEFSPMIPRSDVGMDALARPELSGACVA